MFSAYACKVSLYMQALRVVSCCRQEASSKSVWSLRGLVEERGMSSPGRHSQN